MDGEFGDMGPPPGYDKTPPRRIDSAANYRSRMEAARRRNNPHNEPTGDHTGRCMQCGSKNLWTDNLSYGCSDCGEIYCRG